MSTRNVTRAQEALAHLTGPDQSHLTVVILGKSLNRKRLENGRILGGNITYALLVLILPDVWDSLELMIVACTTDRTLCRMDVGLKQHGDSLVSNPDRFLNVSLNNSCVSKRLFFILDTLPEKYHCETASKVAQLPFSVIWENYILIKMYFLSKRKGFL